MYGIVFHREFPTCYVLNRLKAIPYSFCCWVVPTPTHPNCILMAFHLDKTYASIFFNRRFDYWLWRYKWKCEIPLFGHSSLTVITIFLYNRNSTSLDLVLCYCNVCLCMRIVVSEEIDANESARKENWTKLVNVIIILEGYSCKQPVKDTDVTLKNHEGHRINQYVQYDHIPRQMAS